MNLPDVHFGTVGKSENIDWKNVSDDEIDDELLKKTPKDVIDILGFDPLDDEG